MITTFSLKEGETRTSSGSIPHPLNIQHRIVLLSFTCVLVGAESWQRGVTKMKINTFFWSKLSKLHKKDPILHNHDNYIFPKTRGNKNKQWIHSTPLKHSTSHSVVVIHLRTVRCGKLAKRDYEKRQGRWCEEARTYALDWWQPYT